MTLYIRIVSDRREEEGKSKREKTGKRLTNKKKYARTRIRTEDLMITSHALYQLSHASFLGGFAL